MDFYHLEEIFQANIKRLDTGINAFERVIHNTAKATCEFL